MPTESNVLLFVFSLIFRPKFKTAQVDNDQKDKPGSDFHHRLLDLSVCPSFYHYLPLPGRYLLVRT